MQSARTYLWPYPTEGAGETYIGRRLAKPIGYDAAEKYNLQAKARSEIPVKEPEPIPYSRPREPEYPEVTPFMSDCVRYGEKGHRANQFNSNKWCNLLKRCRNRNRIFEISLKQRVNVPIVYE